MIKKTIAILELYQHDEVLRHYCDMLIYSNFKITFFCSKTVYDHLPHYHQVENFKWYVKPQELTIPEFLKKNSIKISSCDLVFITTALSHFRAFYRISKSGKTLLLIHNVHSFLAPDKYLDFQFPIIDRLRWLKSALNRSSFYKKKILESAAGLAFPTEEVLEYVRANFDLPKHVQTISLPFSYYQEKEPVRTDQTTITIPCTVSSQLRDYQSVLNAFTQIIGQLNERIRLVLLGKPKGDGHQIIRAFQRLNNSNLEVLTFDGFISTKAYEKWIRESDFLILPLKKYGRNYIYRERLGHSKISGGVNDLIRFGIPALISEFYPLSNDLKHISVFYSLDELPHILQKWITEKTYLQLKKQKEGLKGKYGKISLQQDFLRKIESIMSLV